MKNLEKLNLFLLLAAIGFGIYMWRKVDALDKKLNPAPTGTTNTTPPTNLSGGSPTTAF